MQTQQYSHSQGIRYHSKIDTWMVVLMCTILLLPILIVLPLAVSGRFTSGAWVALFFVVFIFVVVAALILALAYPLYYDITPATLIVQSGRRHQEIPLASIQHVFPTRNPRNGPAWSLDRLQIDYTQNGHRCFVLISPKGKLQFLHDLATSAGDLEVQDEGVVRR